MKTKTVAATAMVALLLAGVAAVSFAHSGVNVPGLSGIGLGSGASHQNQTNHTGDDEQGNQTNTQHQEDNETESEVSSLNLTVGQTFTLSNLTGHSNNLTNQSEEDGSDNSRAMGATGSFTFKVTSVSNGTTTLSIVSGSFTINGTAYTVTGGTVTLSAGQESGSGTGTTSGNHTFAIQVAGLHGTTGSISVGAVKLDVKVGTSSYQVILGSGGSSDGGSENSGAGES